MNNFNYNRGMPRRDDSVREFRFRRETYKPLEPDKVNDVIRDYLMSMSNYGIAYIVEYLLKKYHAKSLVAGGSYSEPPNNNNTFLYTFSFPLNNTDVSKFKDYELNYHTPEDYARIVKELNLLESMIKNLDYTKDKIKDKMFNQILLKK
ncbi:MAG: hypothetical protein N3E37_02255 [Candidatus Micrarchaeota archaeon]|nr:hypothetical protein [Candidatus Micrarchaeota archaeon]